MKSTTAGAAPVAPRRKKRQLTPFLLLSGPVLLLLAGLGYPLFWQVVTSLQEYGLAQQFGQPPVFAGLDNYARIFADNSVWAVVVRSLIFCFFNAIVTVLIGLAFALLMRAVHGPVRIAIQVALLLAWAMPMAAESEVLPCPAIKASCSLSRGLGNPEMPPSMRSRSNPSLRPVRILCV